MKGEEIRIKLPVWVLDLTSLGVCGNLLATLLHPALGEAAWAPCFGFQLLCIGIVLYDLVMRGKWSWKSVLLVTCLVLSAWYAGRSLPVENLIAERGFYATSLSFGVMAFSLNLHTSARLLRAGEALVLGLVVTSLILHLLPAHTIEAGGWRELTGRFILHMDDPYFYYRYATYVAEEGHLPDKERLAYPTDPPDHSAARFLLPVMMGSLASLLDTSVHNIAMLISAIFAALTTLLVYLLLREAFPGFEPHREVVALFGAFLLAFSPAFASRAIATSCEDDALGAFLAASSIYLTLRAYRLRSLKLMGLAGLGLLMLNLAWGGYSYVALVLGLALLLVSLCSMIGSLITKESQGFLQLKLLPFALGPIIISHLAFLWLHPHGELWGPHPLPLFVQLLVISGLLASILSAWVEKAFAKSARPEGEGFESFLLRNITPLAAVTLVLLAMGLLLWGPRLLNYWAHIIGGARVEDIIEQTTAEQQPVCGTLGEMLRSPAEIVRCVKSLSELFGVSVVYAVIAAPILLVSSFLRPKSYGVGSAFVLSWSLPLLYGISQKQQFLFAASTPIVVLGASIALFCCLSKKDTKGNESLFRIPLTLILLMLPFGSLLANPAFDLLQPFGIERLILNPNSASWERYYWEPALQWLRRLPEDAVILTWWDYGHIITAVAKKRSVLDNLKARGYMVQDIAKFHVLVESEGEALEIAKRYSATHVVIDYTMIAKAGAPHFIATSDLGGNVASFRAFAKASCGEKNCERAIDEDPKTYAELECEEELRVEFGKRYLIRELRIDAEGAPYQVLSPQGEVLLEANGSAKQDVGKELEGVVIKCQNGKLRVKEVSALAERRKGEWNHYYELRFGGVRLLPNGLFRVSLRPQVPIHCEGQTYIGQIVVDVPPKLVEDEWWPAFEAITGDNLKLELWECHNMVCEARGLVPWRVGMCEGCSSILGVLPTSELLRKVVMQDLICVPREFENYMITRLYLGDYLEEYQRRGLANPNIERPKHFRLIMGFPSAEEDPGKDWVKVYEVVYS